MTHPMTTRPAAHPDQDEFHDDIIYPQVVPFVLVHVAALAAFFTGVTWP